MRFLRTSCLRILWILIFSLSLPLPSVFADPVSLISYSPEDYEMLSQISRNSFQYFLEFTDKKTGLTRDSSQPGSPASIAATGFYLASLGVAKENGWLNHKETYNRARITLITALRRADNERGFFYHFLSPQTGRRAWASEASSMDTALFLAGALYIGQVFKNTEIERLANQISKRVDWQWMTNGYYLISHGWTPEKGFLPYYWDMYSEHLILQAFALGSSRHAVSDEVWQEWKRLKEKYNEKEIVYSHSGSLFTYQYSHAFIDFRNLSDQGINYFDNSVKASQANREFCLGQSDQHLGYSLAWGLTACLGPAGYVAYGAPPCGGDCRSDGTLAPSGAIASLPFTPLESLEAIRGLWAIRDRIFTPLGFTDSFNLGKNWYSKEYLGIDQGITILMIENFLDGKIWNKFMQVPVIQNWIKRAGLQEKVVPAAPLSEGPVTPLKS